MKSIHILAAGFGLLLPFSIFIIFLCDAINAPNIKCEYLREYNPIK